MVMLLWASKFATAKIECSSEVGKKTPLGGTIYFAVDGIIPRHLKIRIRNTDIRSVFAL